MVRPQGARGLGERVLYGCDGTQLPAETSAALARAEGGVPRPPAPERGIAEDDLVGWKQVLCVLGFPIEIDATPLRREPLATWTLLAMIAVISVLGFYRLEPEEWGLIPSQPWRHGGLTLPTSFFLHANLSHLLGNLYFLAVFGDDVEEFLGRGPYLLLIVAAAATGDALHWAFYADSTVPAIGASGGISGVLAPYGTRFPRRRLQFWRWVWFEMRASTAIFLWVVTQVIGAAMAAGDVSYIAHLGGAAVGFVFCIVAR